MRGVGNKVLFFWQVRLASICKNPSECVLGPSSGFEARSRDLVSGFGSRAAGLRCDAALAYFKATLAAAAQDTADSDEESLPSSCFGFPSCFSKHVSFCIVGQGGCCANRSARAGDNFSGSSNCQYG